MNVDAHLCYPQIIIHQIIQLIIYLSFYISSFLLLLSDQDNADLFDRFKGRLTRLQESIAEELISDGPPCPARFSRTTLCITWYTHLHGWRVLRGDASVAALEGACISQLFYF